MGYSRNIEDKRRLEKLCNETKYNWAYGAFFSDVKNRYVKISISSGRMRHNWVSSCKKRNRQQVRRLLNKSTMSFNEHGKYRKLRELNWLLW